MKLNMIENKDGKMVLEVSGETHTLLNLLRVNAWKAGAKQASYIVKHPYLSQPELVVKADNPKKVIQSAAQAVVDEADEFGKKFRKAVK